MTDKPKCLGGNMSESKEWAFGAECLAGSPDCSLDERRFLRRGRYPTLAMASPGEQTESPLKAGVAVLANRILYCACISAIRARRAAFARRGAAAHPAGIRHCYELSTGGNVGSRGARPGW